jgi:hypothetical protein
MPVVLAQPWPEFPAAEQKLTERQMELRHPGGDRDSPQLAAQRLVVLAGPFEPERPPMQAFGLLVLALPAFP